MRNSTPTITVSKTSQSIVVSRLYFNSKALTLLGINPDCGGEQKILITPDPKNKTVYFKKSDSEKAVNLNINKGTVMCINAAFVKEIAEIFIPGHVDDASFKFKLDVYKNLEIPGGGFKCSMQKGLNLNHYQERFELIKKQIKELKGQISGNREVDQTTRKTILRMVDLLENKTVKKEKSF